MENNNEKDSVEKFFGQFGKFLNSAFRSSSHKAISLKEKELLFERIVNTTNEIKNKPCHSNLQWYKYAAVFIGFIVLVGSVYFTAIFSQEKVDFESMLSQLDVENLDQAQLIISDQETIILEGESSFIDYQSTKSVVVNETQAPNSSMGEFNTLIIPYGKRSQVLLPDGSKVYLNSGSKMVYPSDFSKNRNIYLEGEAFFDVIKDESSPFIVTTKELSYKVLGTSFNVNSYSTSEGSSAVLVSGSIEVKPENESFFRSEKHILKPNQKVQLIKESKTINIQNVDVEQYVSWKDGYLIFDQHSIKQISERLEVLYNVEIEVSKKALASETFTGRLDLKTDIEKVLKTIASTSGATITKQERRYEFN
ncbi:FecR domain-containing protein [Belliella sp. R4-6]|uniref:FecR domain-containing protein n=1 Tax=Belliella alkalica TaxID=1730871 RepID=A0ABS9VFN7_9BACT|nr:FecR domain-containing protein [Belliella alkalica]MCH7415236.1 FecR domain-containing protein [Belliella alkalica]